MVCISLLEILQTFLVKVGDSSHERHSGSGEQRGGMGEPGNLLLVIIKIILSCHFDLMITKSIAGSKLIWMMCFHFL